MPNLKKTIGVLIFSSVSFFLCSQCPDGVNVKDTLKTNDLETIKKLSLQFENCKEKQDSLGLIYHKIGTIYYSQFYDLDSAVIFTEKALSIRKSLFSDNPNIDLGKSFHNLGAFYAKLGNHKIAQQRLINAIDIYKELNESRLIRSYIELANVHQAMGEYEIAKDYFNLVIQLAEKLDDQSRMAKALSDLGWLLNKQKKYDDAIPLLEKAKSIFDVNEMELDLAACYENLSISNYNLGKKSTAIDNVKSAIEIYKNTDNCEGEARAYNNLGIRYSDDSQNRLAFKTLEMALKAAQNCNTKEYIAQSHDNLGEYYLSQKDYKKALSHFQKAIKTLLAQFNPNEDIENPTVENTKFLSNKIDLLIYLGDKAKSLRLLAQVDNSQKYLSSSLELFELGDAVIDQLRQEHQDQNTKLFWRKEAIPFYERAIEVCYKMQDVDKAFFFFEKSKAILLLEALQTSDAMDLIPDNLRIEIQNLQKQILQTKEDSENQSLSEIEKEKTIKELIRLQNNFEFRTEQLAKDYPRFFDVKFGTRVLSLGEVQNEISNTVNKAGVHFFYGEKSIYAITILSQKTKLYQLGSTPTIEKEIRDLLAFFEKSSNIENSPNDFLKQSKKVYDILIAPLSLGKENDVIVFPDGAIAYLPFEALVISDSKDIASANYLIKQHKIQYGYSATIFSKQNKNTNNSTENSIAAYAPFADGSTNSNYAALSFSQDELKEISQRLTGDFLKNEEASKSNFLEKSNQYSVLHLSTHAFSSATESKPHIVFADTSLFLSELYGLEIPANLVVLSACQSNIGKLSPGEGVMSLGRGFTFAGAKSLVSSLWNVNAVSTSNILSDFYQNLQNQKSKYESLHAAKIAYLENENIPSYERSPYYWAGLIYYGDDGGVLLKEKTSNYFYVLLAFGVLCFLFGFYYSRKK